MAMDRKWMGAAVACVVLGTGCLGGLSVPVSPGPSGGADLGSVTPLVDLAEPPLDIFRPPVRAETCNAVDDDGDGLVDEGCPRPVPSPPGNVWGAGVSGDTILINTDDGVYVQHGVDGAATLLAPDSWDGKIAGDWVTYQVPPPAGSDPEQGGTQYVRNLVTGETFAVPVPRHYQNRWTSLGEHWFAWSQQVSYDGANSDVYALDLLTGQQWTVASDVNDSKAPVVDGETLWFLDDRGHWTESGWPYFDSGRYDVAISALPPETPRRWVTAFTDETGYLSQWSLVANSGFLYLDAFAPTAQVDPCGIARIEAATGTRSMLYASSKAEGCDRVAAVGPRWLVAQRDVGVGSTLRLYDLTKPLDPPRALTTYVTGVGSVSLSGDHLSWVDGRTGEARVWSMDLSQIDKGEFHPEGQ